MTMTAISGTIPKTAMGKHKSDDYFSSSVSSSSSSEQEEEEERRRRRRQKKEKSKKKKSRKKRRRKYYSSSDDDDGSSSDDDLNDDDDDDGVDDRRKRKQKQKRKKKHKKNKKKSKKRHKKGDDNNDNKSSQLLPEEQGFADAVYSLLDRHPALSQDLPIMLIRMAGGASFSFQQMTDRDAAHGLEQVFGCLQKYGLQRDNDNNNNNSWTWKSHSAFTTTRGNSTTELFLIKIATTLLDQMGLTMEAIQSFEKQQQHQQQSSTDEIQQQQQPSSLSLLTPLQKQTMDLLGRFLQNDASLPQQLGQLCQMVLDGESVSIDGIPNQMLKSNMESLFRAAGLERAEIINDDDDDSSDSDNNEGGGSPTMGYGLPETNDDFAKRNLHNMIRVCQTKQEQAAAATTRSIQGPLPQHRANEYANHESDDDSEGPEPLGTTKQRWAPTISDDTVKAMAEQRAQQMAEATGMDIPTATGEREEWMMKPGQHDLLQSIKSGNVMKSRNFQNKKNCAAATTTAPIDPSVQAEVDAIRQRHAESRGPSLMDQHTQKNKQQQKQQRANGFSWNREKNLDDGRRVDKDALKMMMGGGSALKEKFQGSISRDF